MTGLGIVGLPGIPQARCRPFRSPGEITASVSDAAGVIDGHSAAIPAPSASSAAVPVLYPVVRSYRSVVHYLPWNASGKGTCVWGANVTVPPQWQLWLWPCPGGTQSTLEFVIGRSISSSRSRISSRTTKAT